MSDSNNAGFPTIETLIPHRPPMQLLNKVLSLDVRSSQSLVKIEEAASFFEKGVGVPAWVGLEYMGQTAALIAGFQQQHGMLDSHLGFLLGVRGYESQVEYFKPNQLLRVSCQESALVGEELALFECRIEVCHESTLAATSLNETLLVTASLSVLRKPVVSFEE